MEILARAVGRRKEAVAQVQLLRGTGQFIINTKSAHEYLQNDSCSILDVQAPFDIFKKNNKTNSIAEPNNQSSVASNQAKNNTNSFLATEFSSNATLNNIDTIVKVKGGGLKGQSEAIRLGIARALCVLDTKVYTEGLNDSANLNTGVEGAHLQENAKLDNQQQTVLTLSNAPNVGLRKQLKDKGYLTQDSRVKERRKYGLKKARKASQYHKR
jgi:small subunit ribosomal protein S9